MGQCPQCGSSAEPDPEHSGMGWCLTCWHSWALPRDTRCGGSMPHLSPALRVLDEHRHLNR